MKTVAIIGAGISGLSAVKCCLDEGMEPVCYEMSSHVGGLWHYTESVNERQACVIKTTVANLSKEMMCFSDFPPDKRTPIYMHNTDALDYFEKYASHNKLLSRIQLNTEVEKLKDFSKTGRWIVTTKQLMTGKLEDREFDAVMVCTGCYTDPHIPVFPGQQSFKGKIMHSHSYRTNKGFENQRVLIVGIGNTAGDIAVELSLVASKVFISSRQGAWLLSRLGVGGCPWCMTSLTRLRNYIGTQFPSLGNKYLYKILNNKFDHEKFSLRPNHPPLKTNGFVNDDLPNRILSGRVSLLSDIKMFTETGVEFVDGSFENDIDVVILATGYRVEFPFLDESVLTDKRNLYKAMFPPDDENKNTIAVIGNFRLRGPVTPVVEMQSRFVARVFKGDIGLPSSDKMWAEIEQRKVDQQRRFNDSQNYSIQVNYIPYMDEIAHLIGCKPNFGQLIFSDPALALQVYLGPCTPYQYRLTGPGSWTGARDAIMTQWDRTYYPVNTRHVHNQYVMESSCIFAFLIFGLIAFFLYYYYL